MVFKESPETTLEGGSNVNVIVTDEAGIRYLKRYPKDNPRTMQLLRHEYAFLDFSQLGGSFQRRSPREQNDFLKHAVQKGLKVLPPTHVDERGFAYYRFLEDAETLDDYLKHASSEDATYVVYELFGDIRLAHANNIIYGDRWSPNILVVPRNQPPQKTTDRGLPVPQAKTIVHIDFDIEITGPLVREFELAEITYFTLCAGRERVLMLLINILGIDVNIPHFDFKAFAGFLEKFSQLFRNDKKYGNAEKEVHALIAGLTATGSRES